VVSDVMAERKERESLGTIQGQQKVMHLQLCKSLLGIPSLTEPSLKLS
jgi:hypothetical protein